MNILLSRFRYFCSSFNKNPYKILGLDINASQDEVKAAYYKMAKQCHPDVQPEMGQQFKEIGEAYNILKDPVRRKQFDLSISRPRPPPRENYDNYFNQGIHNPNNVRYGSPDSRFRSYNQQFYQNSFNQNPFSRNASKKMNREFARQMFNQSYRMNYRGVNNPNDVTRMFFGLLMIMTFIVMMYQMMYNIYAFDEIKRQGYRVGYIPIPENHDIDQENDFDY